MYNELNQKNVDNFMLVLIMILWTIISLNSSIYIGFIGLAIIYRRISKRISKKESEALIK